MRLLAITTLCALATPAFGADKDEDNAREAVALFMKALRAKDVDAAVKVADVPFLIWDKEGPQAVEKAEDLKTRIRAKMATLPDPEKVPLAAAELVDLPALRKMAVGKKEAEEIKNLEKVLGAKGYAAFLGKEGPRGGFVLVRIKDGKAAVVGVR